MTEVKPTLSLDFDKPIHGYNQGWNQGKILDANPQIGARSAIERLAQKYRLVVTTARTDFDPVHKALDDWGLAEHISDVSNVKPPAVAYIDDKAVQWVNWDQAISDLRRLTGDEV